MLNIDSSEIWRTIPPEEKIDLLNRAHSKGIFAASLTILICSTIAVSLKLSWFMWGAFLTSPLIFQFAAGKAWRDLRPRLVLEYLAARSAARRYAFANKSKDLALTMMFRGDFEEVYEDGDPQAALEAAIAGNNQSASWIALFTDAVVVMSEHPGGARCQLASILNDRLEVEGVGKGDSDYSRSREVIITLLPKKDSGLKSGRRFRIRSQHPAALVVFEKRLKSDLEASKQLQLTQLAAPELPPPAEDDFMPMDEDSSMS
ncbi:MAG: hypothetical protein K1X79_02950 [Oligoflexia bacterium]|nr:hypothetical protein [Oligoflexia bacterium]